MLASIVHRKSSQATFPLKFSETIDQETVNLECLFVYATPLAFTPYDENIVELTRDWKVSATLEYLEEATQLTNLGLKGVVAETFLNFATELYNQVLQLSVGPYEFHKTKLRFTFDLDGPSSMLTLPPGWYAEFSSKSLASVFGLDKQFLTVDSTENDDGTFTLKNTFADSPAIVSGKIEEIGNVIINQALNTPIFVKFGPTVQTRKSSYKDVRPKIESSTASIKTWVNTAVKELLSNLELQKNLVTCKLTKSGLNLLANQDLDHQPILLKFDKDTALSSDLHSIDVGTTVLHFNLKPFKAATLDASAEGVFAKWSNIVAKRNVVWTDPLKQIAPFYLLADGQEGSSLMDTNFVSVAALVGHNLQVKERTTLKIKIRQNQLTLKFVDSYLEDCVFNTAFNIFLVCRIF